MPAGPKATEAAAGWLASHASRLDRETVARIGAAALDAVAGERSGGATLVDLAEAARVAGLDELQLGVEKATTDNLVDGLLEGRPDPTSSARVPIKSQRGLRYASQRCAEVLIDLPADKAVMLLMWAERTYLKLDAALLRWCGQHFVAPMLLGGADDVAPRLMQAWPPLRQGVLGHLDNEAQRDSDRVVTALVGRPGLELTPHETKSAPALHEALLVARARHDPTSRPRILGMIVKTRRGTGVYRVDGALLARIWPDGRWTAAEAAAVLKELAGDAVASPAVTPWFEAVFDEAGVATAKSSFEEQEALCRAVEKSPVYQSLSRSARTNVDHVLRLGRELKGASGPVKQAAVLAKGIDGLPRQQQQRSFKKLMKILDGAHSDDIARILAASPRSVVTRYLDEVKPVLRRNRPGSDVAAALYYTVYRLEEGPHSSRQTAKYIESVLLGSLATWAWRDLKKVEGELRRLDREIADDFVEWRGLNAGGLLRRILMKRRIKRREEAPAKAAEKTRKKEEAAKRAEERKKAAAKRKREEKEQRKVKHKQDEAKKKKDEEERRKAAAAKRKQDDDERRKAAAAKRKRDDDERRRRR